MISIIIPVYNAEKYISRCLDSILRSSFQNFEIIIVNDGSKDNTKNIIENYRLRDRRIKVISKINGGSASARNVGINNTSGEYIAFIDADDYIHVDYLKILEQAIRDYDVDIVECDFFTISKKNNRKIKAQKKNDVRIINNVEKLKEFCERSTYLKSAVLWNKLYKKKLFEKVSFVENKWIDDEYVIYKLYFYANKIAIVDEKLYYYFLSENSQMRSKPNLKKLDTIDVIERQMLFFDEKGLSCLKEKLYYRYYRSILGNISFLKKNFPKEKEKIKMLVKKRKKIFQVFFSKYVPINEKVYLIIFFIMQQILML